MGGREAFGPGVPWSGSFDPPPLEPLWLATSINGMHLVERIDWGLVLVAIGLTIMTVSAVGEFLGWWDQGGEWGFWVGILVTGLGVYLTASRRQARRLLEGNQRIERGVGRAEQGVGRVERSIQGQTEEVVPLLREIRDRLPPYRPEP